MHRRASGRPGPSATRARLPRVLHPPRGHSRGHCCSSGRQHPLPLQLPLPRSPHHVSRMPLAPLRFGRILPNRSLALGGEWGWERPPSDRAIYSPGVRTYARTYFRGSRSLPARACGAMYPCGKASNPPARWVEEAASDGAGRRVVLAADTGIEPPLTEAAHDLVARLQGVGEPEGLHRPKGGLVRPRDAGGDHNGGPLSRERTGAGVRGRRPRPPAVPAAARDAGGSKGGAASPRQSTVSNTV